MKKTVRIIGVPMDLGQSRRGVDMGPSAIRYAGLHEKLLHLGISVEDLGNIPVEDRDTLAGDIPLTDAPPAALSLALPIADTCGRLYQLARQAIADGCFPLFLGGDHSMAIGSVGGVTHDTPAGVLWIDAHGDFNIPETSPNGNIHGMPVAVLTGYGLDQLVDLGRPGAKLAPGQIVLYGIRNLDYDERTLLKNSGITVFTMRDIDERGLAATAHEAIDKLSRWGRLHVSLDMDILDPSEAPGVGTKAPGGISYREAHLLMEILAETGRVGSADVVEINPILDLYNRTSSLAVELVASLLGDKIF